MKLDKSDRRDREKGGVAFAFRGKRRR